MSHTETSGRFHQLAPLNICRLRFLIPVFRRENGGSERLNDLSGHSAKLASQTYTPGLESRMPALGICLCFQEASARGEGNRDFGQLPPQAPGALYLAFLHDRLLPTLGAVACHDASPKVLAVSSALLHGVGLGVIASAMGWGSALGQAELPAEGAVLLFHLAHAHLQALTLPLAGGCVPGAVRLGLQRRQRHWLSIWGAKHQGSVNLDEPCLKPLQVPQTAIITW